jgi:hypothetical protein
MINRDGEDEVNRGAEAKDDDTVQYSYSFCTSTVQFGHAFSFGDMVWVLLCSVLLYLYEVLRKRELMYGV